MREAITTRQVKQDPENSSIYGFSVDYGRIVVVAYLALENSDAQKIFLNSK